MDCANPNLFHKTTHRFLGNWEYVSIWNPELLDYAICRDCRKCTHCRKKRGGNLAFECYLEKHEYEHNHFITLTKNPEYHKEHPKYEKREIKNFIKALQRWCKKENGVTPKIYRVHEHGEKGRSHYHIIAFNLQIHDLQQTPRPDTLSSDTIERIWKHGHITVQDLNHATAMYQSMYMDKDFINGHANSDRRAVSYHSGIGTRSFLRNYKQWFTLGYIPFGDLKRAIPRKFTRIAQKHLDAITLTNEQYCWKYSKENTKKIINGEKTKLCNITIDVNHELAMIYLQFKNKPREEKKNNEKIQQIKSYVTKERKLKPDFHLAGENTVYNEKNKLQKGNF